MVKTLYHRLYNGILLCCLSNMEAQEGIKEAHDGICSTHHPSLKFKDWLHRLDYYWPIIYRFSVPMRIIHDNGPQFASQSFYQFCDKYQIQNVASTAYHPAINGLIEAFNKMIIKIFKKFIFSSKRDWNEKLSECLWPTE